MASWFSNLRDLLTPEGLFTLMAILGRIALILVAAWLAGVVLQRAFGAFLARLERRSPWFTVERTAELKQIVRALIRVGIGLAALVAVLDAFGVEARALVRDPQLRGYLDALLIIAAAHVIIRVGSLLIDEIFARAQTRAETDPRIDAQRAVTLRGLLRSVLRYAVDTAAVLMVLSELGFNTNALLASVGVVSLAVGFGAQSLVRDVLAGFFILFEDQFQVGDHVELAGVEGFVQEIGFRVTKVRAWDGSLHIIPNGEITRVRNAARSPMRVMFEVRVAYEEDIDRALQVLQAVCDRFRGDPRVTNGPMVLGVSGFADSWLNVLIWGHAEPGQQWAVTRELRLAVKKALDEAGIQAPYPRTILTPAGEAVGTARPGQVAGE